MVAITENAISLPHCEFYSLLPHNKNLFVLHFHKACKVTLENSILVPIWLSARNVIVKYFHGTYLQSARVLACK